MYGREEKARIFSQSHLGVMPGRGGLAIQELMGHGIPVVSGIADGTERDLISDGRNGYVLGKLLTPEDIELRVRQFESLGLEQKRAMAEQAVEMVLRTANAGTMAEGFVQAVVAAARGAAATCEAAAEQG
jgi:glycosyltransferase involved in cell wall biosynthesis